MNTRENHSHTQQHLYNIRCRHEYVCLSDRQSGKGNFHRDEKKLPDYLAVPNNLLLLSLSLSLSLSLIYIGNVSDATPRFIPHAYACGGSRQTPVGKGFPEVSFARSAMSLFSRAKRGTATESSLFRHQKSRLPRAVNLYTVSGKFLTVYKFTGKRLEKYFYTYRNFPLTVYKFKASPNPGFRERRQAARQREKRADSPDVQ